MKTSLILNKNLFIGYSSVFAVESLTVLERALLRVQERLRDFAGDPLFAQKLALAFGEDYDDRAVRELAIAWREGDFEGLPAIEIRSTQEMNGANGAFAVATDRIYLNDQFLARGANAPEAIERVLLEEIGHWIDRLLPQNDSPGDEGAIFAALVLGESLSDEALGQLRAEDDTGVITINGQEIVVEMQNFTGTTGNDTIVGTSSDDVIDGLEGNDNLSGLEGNDTINPGFGIDIVNAGEGDDLLIVDYSTASHHLFSIAMQNVGPLVANAIGGFNGTFRAFETRNSGTASQVVFSSIERFHISGTSVSDSITTGSGNDTINGNQGDDVIVGGGGDDALNGGIGNDALYGLEGNDSIKGDEGNDYLEGGTGNDTLEGGTGNDTIVQGSGVNVIDGGEGLDTLVDADFSSLNVNLTFDDSGNTYPDTVLANGTTIRNVEYFGSSGSRVMIKSYGEKQPKKRSRIFSKLINP